MSAAVGADHRRWAGYEQNIAHGIDQLDSGMKFEALV
jgi:hypothetical protein